MTQQGARISWSWSCISVDSISRDVFPKNFKEINALDVHKKWICNIFWNYFTTLYDANMYWDLRSQWGGILSEVKYLIVCICVVFTIKVWNKHTYERFLDIFLVKAQLYEKKNTDSEKKNYPIVLRESNIENDDWCNVDGKT